MHRRHPSTPVDCDLMSALTFHTFMLAAAAAMCVHASSLNAQESALDQPPPGLGDASCDADSDITTMVSRYTVDQTIQRLKENLEMAGLSVVAILEQSVAGDKTGAQSRHQEMLVIGGDPHARTLLTNATPLVALDLPMKMLVWKDDEPVKVSFKEVECLRQRYDLTPQAVKYFSHIEEAAERALR
jgi:uncharacterized protein (DUF302 family)